MFDWTSVRKCRWACSPRQYRAILASVLMILIVASWYPFRLDPPRVHANGLVTEEPDVWRFASPGMAVSATPPWWLAAALEHERLVLDFRVRPDRTDQTGPARIVSVAAAASASQDTRSHNLVVGQDDGDLVVRVRRPGSNKRGQPEIRVERVFESADWRHITLRLEPSAIIVEVDGESRARLHTPDGWAQTWDDQMVASVGNTPSGSRPWFGAVRAGSASAGDTAGPLLDRHQFDVPDRFFAVPSRLSEGVDRPRWERIGTSLLHVLAGLALAITLVRARPAGSVRSALAIAVAISLVVNVGKVVIATRHPSILTISLQVGGASLGVLLLSVRPRPVSFGHRSVPFCGTRTP